MLFESLNGESVIGEQGTEVIGAFLPHAGIPVQALSVVGRQGRLDRGGRDQVGQQRSAGQHVRTVPGRPPHGEPVDT